jgi:hypothetical protein
MSLVGFGQVDPITDTITAISPTGAACSGTPNPCTWGDYLGVPSAPCLSWYQTCTPDSAWQSTLQADVIGGALQAQGVKSIVTSTASAAGDVASNAAGSLFSSMFSGVSAATGIPTWGIFLGLGVAAFFLLKDMVKK